MGAQEVVSSDRMDFFGLRFDNLTMAEAVERVERFISEGRPRMIFAPNVHLLIWARSNVELRRIYEACDLVPVDGMGIYYASHLLARPFKASVSASLLMFELLRTAVRRRYRVYLLGTRPEILERAVENIRKQYPSLLIAGAHHGYFTEAQETRVVEAIARSNADLLFVGMSSPRKERFVSTHLHELGVPVCMGVGGSIDILGGAMRLAPDWIRKAGLEWLYRLVQEPRRLWKRYLTTNTVFACLVLRTMLAQRMVSAARALRIMDREESA